MEPAPLNDPAPDHDAALEAWLRQNATLTLLPRDDFTRRVLAAVPSRPTPGQIAAFAQELRSTQRRRLTSCAVGGVVGLLVAALSRPDAQALFASARDLLSDAYTPQPLPEADPIPLTLASLAIAASLAFVYWKRLELVLRLFKS